MPPKPSLLLYLLLLLSTSSWPLLIQHILFWLRSRKDTRLPITLSILQKFVLASNKTNFDIFLRRIFIAMCTLAFHAFLWVREMTLSQNNLPFKSISLDEGFLVLEFLNYKHSNEHVSLHKVEANPSSLHCPVSARTAYLQLRGNSPGPLFLIKTG